jgi:hypothetical protein
LPEAFEGVKTEAEEKTAKGEASAQPGETAEQKTSRESIEKEEAAEKALLEKEAAEQKGSHTNRVAAPSCTQQAPFTFNGETSQFPHAAYKAK